LETGKHLLAEKPISVHKSDAERLIAAHRDSNQVFAAMFNQRTDPRFVKLRVASSVRRKQGTVREAARHEGCRTLSQSSGGSSAN
jgi:predicted dehydrogenase